MQNNKNDQKIQISLDDGSQIELDSRIKRVSRLIEQQFDENEKEQLNCDLLNIEQITFIIKYLEQHNYDLSQSTTSSNVAISSNLQDHFTNQIDLLLFQDLSMEQISSYLRAAVYLQIQELTNLCLIALSTKIYIGYDEQSLSNIRDQLNIPDITDDDINSLKSKYQWAFNINNNHTENH